MATAVESPIDVFISYSWQDREWVQEELIPQLQAAQLSFIIDDRDFEIGVPTITNIANAISRSRNLVLVLTPFWFHSKWTQYELNTGLTRDLSKESYRVWPLLLGPCDIPTSISSLTFVDLTDLSTRAERLEKFFRQLGITQKSIDEKAARSATAGLGALIQLMRTPAIRDVAGDIHDSFEYASQQIEILNKYKRLHDYFQRVEGSFNVVLDRKRFLIQNIGTWDDIQQPAEKLDADLRALVSYARSVFPTNEVLWTHKLELGQDRLSQAIQQEQAESLDGSVQLHHQVLGQIPSRLNAQLVQIAKNLPLQTLTQRLATVRDRIQALNLQGDAADRFKAFIGGIEALKNLDHSLSTFIENHNALQAIDNELRLFDLTKATGTHIQDVWMILKEMVSTLNDTVGSGWVSDLRHVADELNVLCHPGSPPLDPTSARKIRQLMIKFWGKMNIGFNQTDADLLAFCEQLRRVGDTLRRGIRSLQNANDSDH